MSSTFALELGNLRAKRKTRLTHSLPAEARSDIGSSTKYNTRNYHTHYEPSLKKKAAGGRELYWLIGVMTTLLQWCLLRELGLTPQECQTRFQAFRGYQQQLLQAGVLGLVPDGTIQ
jgi:ApeA N-terminal domain 1